MKKIATIMIVVLLALSGCSAGSSKEKEHLTPGDLLVELPNECPQLLEYNCNGWNFLYLIPTTCDINIEEICGELTKNGFEYEVVEDSETKIYIKNTSQE